MKRLNKDKLLLFAALLLMTCLWGCGKKSADNAPVTTASKDYVYKAEVLENIFGQENIMIDRMVRSGDTFYAYGYEWNEETESSVLMVYQISEEGTLENEYSIPVEENASFRYLTMDDEGNIYCIINEIQEIAGETDSETGEEMMDYIDTYYLTKMNLQGERIFSTNLNEIPEFKTRWEEDGYFYVSELMLDKEKGIYVNAMGLLGKFDLECNFREMMEESKWDELSAANFIMLNDGRVAAYMYEDDGIVLALADLENGTLGERYKVPGRSYEFSYYPGVGYDLYMADSNSLYGYNIGDEDKTMLMNYIDSDLATYNVYNVVGINERQFFAFCDGENVPVKFTKVDPKDVKDKKQITLATVYTNWQIRQEVVEFNKSNDEYRITIMDYNSLYGTDEDYMAGLNKLNTDIVSGKVPDILVVEENMPVNSYINKGLFDDLKPYINEDQDIDMNDLMPNVIEAFSTDGKLYTLMPSYYIETLVAKTSDVGAERGWTVQEAKDLLASKPEETQFINNVTREEMLDACMSMADGQFIDWESGKCNFNSDEFIQMIEFIKSFPEEVNMDEVEDDYWINYDAMWREGKVITSKVGISNFNYYNYLEKGTYGEKITMIGFPTSAGDGSVIHPTFQLAISSKSPNKEGAWTFVRTFLLEEYQAGETNYNLPISIKRLKELAEEATQRPYYIDEKGNKVEYDETYYIGEVEIVIPPMTKQETEEFMEQLYSFTEVYHHDDSLINIIKEEIAPYFKGQKSAKDVAAIINSRAQIYVSENR